MSLRMLAIFVAVAVAATTAAAAARTSCMSLPMMAISAMIHRKYRSTGLNCCLQAWRQAAAAAAAAAAINPAQL
jgi:hypothetical protein